MKINPAVVFAITPFAIMAVLCCGGFGYFMATMPDAYTEAMESTPSTNKPVKKPKPDLPYSVIGEDSLAKVKYQVDYRINVPKGTLPSREQLIRISDQVEKDHPGYERYFVTFFLPQMEVGRGAFATAHRDPKVELKINAFMVPSDRVEEVSAFYDQ